MGLIERLAASMGLERRSEPVAALERRYVVSGPWDALFPSSSAGPAVSVREAECLAAVTACVGVVASAIASLPALIYRRQPNGDRTEATDDPRHALIRGGPNRWQTWPDFVEALTAQALLFGNGLAAIERDRDGLATELRLVPWTGVSATVLPTGRLVYDVSETAPPNRTYRLLDTDALHIRDRSDNGVIGRSRLARAGDAIRAGLNVQSFASHFMGNAARPSGVLINEGELGPDEYAQLREEIEEAHAGYANSGRPLLLSNGLKWQSIQVSPEDAELLASRKFSVEEVCRIFQVPPPLVQDYSHNTFTNAETAGRWFAQFTLGPWARKIEAAFSRAIFPAGSGLELELDLSGFLRGDPATRWAAHKIALETGVLDADEVRAVEGYNARAAPAAPSEAE